MNRTYELMFIVRPDMTEEDLDKLIATLSGVVPTSGGTVQKVDKMGKRRLAYTVRRFHEGIYVLMVVEGGGRGDSRTGAPPARDRAGHQIPHSTYR